MVYKNKLIAAIKVSGKTLLEKSGDVVEVPFKSEYSIFLKNLETRKCKVDITIDGTNVTEGGIVLNAQASLNLERFLDDNRKFKFIAKSKAIEDHRGNKPEDGLIIITYRFESVERLNFYPSPYISKSSPFPYIPDYNNPNQYDYDITRSVNISGSLGSLRSLNISNDTENGITVKGSKSNQTFETVQSFDTDAPDTIIFKLVGTNEIQTKKSKKTCPSCGKRNKSKNKYCSDCGTYLN